MVIRYSQKTVTVVERSNEADQGYGPNFSKRWVSWRGEKFMGIEQKRVGLGSYDEMTLNCAENTKRLASYAIGLARNAIYFATNAI